MCLCVYMCMCVNMCSCVFTCMFNITSGLTSVRPRASSAVRLVLLALQQLNVTWFSSRVGGRTARPTRATVPEHQAADMRTSRLLLAAALALVAAGSGGSQAEVIDDILGSLSRGASFLELQHEHINLDGVVGFLMLQAELKEAVRTWPHSDPVSWAQRTSAVALVRHLDRSFEKAVAALQQNDPKYYQEFEPLLSWRFWQIPQEWSSTDASLVYPSTMTTECYDEQLSDKCLTLLLGTWKMKGTPCIVTKPCRDTMTRFGCPHYSLSHQLLYFMIGKMRGCSNLLKGDMRPSRSNMTERSYQKIFCSNMMKTNQDIIGDGLTEQTVDIFIENILICGLAGFSDFYKADWLQHILRLQDDEVGCFGRDKSIASQIIGDELLEQLQPHSRVKRREKILPDGCSSHMTAVAVGALGGYLNYYLAEQDITKRPLS